MSWYAREVNPLFVRLAAIFGFLGVALGAFGAHALKDRLSPDMLAIYQTGVQYQVIHALALLLVGIGLRGRAATWSGRLFVGGIVIFSGSLYALALSGVKVLGAITPLGGVCFLAGWAMVFVAAGAKNG